MYVVVHRRPGRERPELDEELFDDLAAARASVEKHERIFASIGVRCQVYELREIEEP